MSFLTGNEEFLRCKKLTEPVYQTPNSVQQALDLASVHKNGIFVIEKNNEKGDRPRKFDRVYEFTDLNFVDQDKKKQETICLNWCKFLNSMNVDFKVTIVSEPRNARRYEQSLMQEAEKSHYPELAEYNNRLIRDGLQKSRQQVRKRLLLTVTCIKKSYAEAENWFQILEATIAPVFAAMGSGLRPLDGLERFRTIRSFFYTDDSWQYDWEEMEHTKRDWKNDLMPVSIRNHKSYLEFPEENMRILFASYLPSVLNEEKTLHELTDFPFYTCVTFDNACIPRRILKQKLTNSNTNNDMQISQELEANARNGNLTGIPSFLKRKKKKEIEGYLEQIEENDENGFYVGILIAIRGADRDQLRANTEEVRIRCAGLGIQLTTYYDQQLQALNTLLPTGARRVKQMRPLLTTSYAAFQPFYSWDLIQPGGCYYGINKKSHNPIIGDRKTLKNSNGVIIGHTGSGKSMLLKITEIGQTLICTEDDIFMIDPQNEMEGITKQFGGEFFDLSSASGICLNPMETPEELLRGKDQKKKELFISSQCEFMEAFLYSIMMGLLPNGLHKSIIYRCVDQVYREAFAKKKPVSPVLKDLKECLQNQPEPEARDLYGALEAYTEHGVKTLSGQSSFSTNSRFVVFGMKSVPELMWEPIMITVMHILSQRIDYNVELQKATHFIVDEGQYVCKHESSCRELEKAYLTYRKFGGICTICLQNISAAMANDKILEIVSNSDFKVFLDQGGDDRNKLSQILELSDQEFRALADPEPGQCLIVWGDKILQCDSKIRKDNPLYQFYTTNFHEAAREQRHVFYRKEDSAGKERLPERVDTHITETEEENTPVLECQDIEEVPEYVADPDAEEKEQRLLACVDSAKQCGEELHVYEAALLCKMEEEDAAYHLKELCHKGYLEEDEKGSYRRKEWNSDKEKKGA